MKLLRLMVPLLVAGCATGANDGLAGRHGKHDDAVRVERMGAITTAALPGRFRQIRPVFERHGV